MGLLAPLYVAGALAVALPIVFHLIRRAPTGRVPFGSLMFLSPSPPRLTRRSRLTNVLLLLLRAAALALLALAFARPFLSGGADAAEAQPRGRRVALLVDVSASMRRGDLWKQAATRLDEAIADLRPADEAALYLFDRSVRPAFTFAEWNGLPPAARPAAMMARLAADPGPTWAGTRLGDALSTTADLLTTEDGVDPAAADRAGRQIVLISDLQQGGHAETLQAHPWPAGVLLKVLAVEQKRPSSNATLSTAPRRPDDADVGNAGRSDTFRVRVSNQPGSDREQFTVTWADERGPLPGATAVNVYVPAGTSRVVVVPRPAAATALADPATRAAAAPTPTRPTAPAELRRADRLLLQGDDADFDNTLYVAPPRRDVARVVYVGDDAAGDANGLRFYLEGALGETPGRQINFVARGSRNPLTDADLARSRLVVVASALTDANATVVRRFAEAGGTTLWVLPNPASVGGLNVAAGVERLDVGEAPGPDYALIGRIDARSPLFAPFADARFADFTKIHFWKHRRVIVDSGSPARATTGPATLPAGWRTIATFDNGDPFLIDRSVGRGRLLIATSGWAPADSQLALSTKFVPLLDGLVRRPDETAGDAQLEVYGPIPLPLAVSGAAGRTLVTPDGRRVAIDVSVIPGDSVDRPGVYHVEAGGESIALAVNLPPDEGRTTPVAVEELERFGAKLGVVPTSEELVARRQQLRTAEQENRQKLWRWVILGVLTLLAVETTAAGVLARRRPALAPE